MLRRPPPKPQAQSRRKKWDTVSLLFIPNALKTKQIPKKKWDIFSTGIRQISTSHQSPVTKRVSQHATLFTRIPLKTKEARTKEVSHFFEAPKRASVSINASYFVGRDSGGTMPLAR
jgi:hypothetical protein